MKMSLELMHALGCIMLLVQGSEYLIEYKNFACRKVRRFLRFYLDDPEFIIVHKFFGCSPNRSLKKTIRKIIHTIKPRRTKI